MKDDKREKTDNNNAEYYGKYTQGRLHHINDGANASWKK